jgi:hypothetical protein
MRSMVMFSLVLMGLWAGQAMATTTLTSTMTVDDDFNLYVSTDDAVNGTFVMTGSTEDRGWTNSFSQTATLTPGVTNYIHVWGWDLNKAIVGFLGEFTLSDTSFHFENGGQTLYTDAAYWDVSNSGFGSGYYAPNNLGYNGDAALLWTQTMGHPVAGISTNAEWIWSGTGAWQETPRYFMTAIYVTEEPPVNRPVPAPAALLLAGIGAGLVGWFRGRKAS